MKNTAGQKRLPKMVDVLTSSAVAVDNYE